MNFMKFWVVFGLTWVGNNDGHNKKNINNTHKQDKLIDRYHIPAEMCIKS